jgi:hypothetical protein
MLQFFRRVAAGFVFPARAARRRPKTALTLAFAVVVVAVGTIYAYARHQWHAAETALRENRPAEARDRLALCLSLWRRDPEVHFLAARAARLTGDFAGAEALLDRCLELQHGATEGVQIEFLL